MESMLPTTVHAHSDDVLGGAVARVSTSLATLERVVEQVMLRVHDAEKSSKAEVQRGLGESELIASLEKWRGRV